MAEYVKIRKSKNLRFRLISLMYLIFLILAAIQIPIGWLSVSQKIQKYLNYSSAISDPFLIQTSSELERIDKDFRVALNYDEKTETFPEPNSYSVTDQFFMTGKSGKEVFELLAGLKKQYSRISDNDPGKKRFIALFEDDLKHGLEKENLDKWIKYRWNHVPAGLARNLLAELNLRVHLLTLTSGDQILETMEEPKFSLMTSYSYLRVGDEATLSTRGDSLREVYVERDGSPNEDYSISGNRIQFSPSVAGQYKIEVKGIVKEETLHIKVLPAGFPKKEALPFRICYTGINYVQPLNISESNLRVFCSSDPDARIVAASRLLEFRPKNEGWCTIRVENKEGILFHDSVYVKPIPDPFFHVKGIPSLSISRKQLNQLGTLEILAYHPSFKDEAYLIQTFKLRTVGSGTSERIVQGNRIQLEPGSLNGLHYLILSNMDVRVGLERKTFDQPLIIQIK